MRMPAGGLWPPFALSRETWFLISLGVLSTVALCVLGHPGYWARPDVVAPALALDLVLGVPLLGYVFLVRGREGQRWLLLPLLGLGLGLARWWIPQSHQAFSDELRALFAWSELILLGYLAGRTVRMRCEYRRLRPQRPRVEALRGALIGVLGPRLGSAVHMEVSALWYATRFLEKEVASRPGETRFHLHRRGGYPAVLGALLLLVLMETTIAHLLLARWSSAAAWISTGLGAYSALWLWGDYHAARLNPVVATERGLDLTVGLRWSASVPWAWIGGIRDRAPDGSSQRMTLMGEADFFIELTAPVEVRGPFGIVRTAHNLGVGVEDPAALRLAITGRVPATRPQERT